MEGQGTLGGGVEGALGKGVLRTLTVTGKYTDEL